MATEKTRRRKRPSRLALEIAVLLALKFVLLLVLWKLFFSTPQAKHMRMPEPQVTERFLGNEK